MEHPTVTPSPAPILVVCAWCQKVLAGSKPAPVTSHGICADCAAVAFDRR